MQQLSVAMWYMNYNQCLCLVHISTWALAWGPWEIDSVCLVLGNWYCCGCSSRIADHDVRCWSVSKSWVHVLFCQAIYLRYRTNQTNYNCTQILCATCYVWFIRWSKWATWQKRTCTQWDSLKFPHRTSWSAIPKEQPQQDRRPSARHEETIPPEPCASAHAPTQTRHKHQVYFMRMRTT